MMSILAEATGGMVGTLGMIIWLVVLFAIMQYNRTIKKRCISKIKNIRNLDFFGKNILYLFRC